MQKGGSVRTFLRHVEMGVEAMKEDEDALLIFSGYVLPSFLPSFFFAKVCFVSCEGQGYPTTGVELIR
jgi:hypothetical protein